MAEEKPTDYTLKPTNYSLSDLSPRPRHEARIRFEAAAAMKQLEDEVLSGVMLAARTERDLSPPWRIASATNAAANSLLKRPPSQRHEVVPRPPPVAAPDSPATSARSSSDASAFHDCNDENSNSANETAAQRHFRWQLPPPKVGPYGPAPPPPRRVRRVLWPEQPELPPQRTQRSHQWAGSLLPDLAMALEPGTTRGVALD